MTTPPRPHAPGPDPATPGPHTPAPDAPAPDDLATLRAGHPTWRFGTVWASAATPGTRRLWATHNGILLTAWTTHELQLKIAAETPD